MKVENPSAVVRPTGPEPTSRTAPKAAEPAGADRVRLSGDLRLASAAMQAADVAGGEVRAEAVARGQALLESGQLGEDLEGLADAIMDALTYSHDDTRS